MEKKITGSPLSKLCYEDSNFLLEAMLPFVPVQFKFILAMLIKWNEVQRIFRIFQTPGRLCDYGLEEQPFSLVKLLSAFQSCPNHALGDNMEQMAQMLRMLQMAQTLTPTEPPSDGTSQSLSDTIDQILSAYEAAPSPDTAATANRQEDDLDVEQFVKEIFS